MINPWLWAIIFGAIFTPIVGVIVFFGIVHHNHKVLEMVVKQAQHQEMMDKLDDLKEIGQDEVRLLSE